MAGNGFWDWDFEVVLGAGTRPCVRACISSNGTCSIGIAPAFRSFPVSILVLGSTKYKYQSLYSGEYQH